MKFFKNIKKGVRLQIIGYIVFFTCWIIPAIITDCLKIQGHIDVIVMLLQMAVGGFLILCGGAIGKKEKEDPSYVIPRNILKVFKAWQILLMIAVVLFFALAFSDLYVETGWLTVVLSFAMYGCFIAAAILGIIQHQKNKKNFVSVGGGKQIRVSNSTSDVPRATVFCLDCRKEILQSDSRNLDGRRLCGSCYMNRMAKVNEIKADAQNKELHTPCAVCNRDFPKSSLHIVDDRFICDDCFQQEYGVTEL